jgi:hypothetical protein
MHQTTLRFGADLWQTLEREAAGTGVSVAQYVRDAALMRVTYDAARRGDPRLEAALAALDEADHGATGSKGKRARPA